MLIDSGKFLLNTESHKDPSSMNFSNEPYIAAGSIQFLNSSDAWN